MKNTYTAIIAIVIGLISNTLPCVAQYAMTNVYGRNHILLNGKWNAVVDPYKHGHKILIYNDRPLKGETDFKEYAWEGGLRLNVPGDWNSQQAELNYYEGTIWYARHFNVNEALKGNLFLHFGAVNYRCTVYLNGVAIGSHEGGFTPFQINITNKVSTGDNFLVVEASNTRSIDAIPALHYDWWNYGGITRDVMLIQTPKVFIDNYFIQLDKEQADLIRAEIKLSEKLAGKPVTIEIPELRLKEQLITDADGKAVAAFKAKKLIRWSPQNPKLYQVKVSSGEDSIEEQIGFRNIQVKGTQITLNGEPFFYKGISFHEEIASRKGRAYSQEDALLLLTEAKELGVNVIRLAHYPQNEYIIRQAEKMGILLWEEIPIWQGIDFTNEQTFEKAKKMYAEMVMRDRNRCALSFWGVANETAVSDVRNRFLKRIIEHCKSMDTTRLITAAFDNMKFNPETNTFELIDPLPAYLDFVSINKYMGWYMPWPSRPSEVRWNVATDKPLVFSEFGCEAQYGQSGDPTIPGSWSEDYQEQLYKDNLAMFNQVPNLAGISPWILFDFRSPRRLHPVNQSCWNKKGLISDGGYRKKAWYVIRDYYNKH